jgi:hypothetical protein
MDISTYIARNGQHGVWYIDVDELSKHIPVLHHTLIGPDEVVWPHQFFRGDHYDQDCHNELSMEKAAQAKRINQIRLVVLTRDFWSKPPVKNSGGIHKRISYVGVFRASHAFYGNGHLIFQVGEQLCHLLKPSDFK